MTTGGMALTVQMEVLGKNCLSASLSATNPTWTSLIPSSGVSIEARCLYSVSLDTANYEEGL
jgi:hypothetical protein